MKETRIVAIVALMFLGVSGVIGAIPLIVNPGGEPWSMPQNLLPIFSVPLVPCSGNHFAGREWSVECLVFVADREQPPGIRLVGNRARSCIARLAHR